MKTTGPATGRNRRRLWGAAVWLGAALGAVLLLGGCAPPLEPPEVEIIDARIRALIPGRDVTAGYFTARNRSDQAVVLIGADSAVARAVEMHMTSNEDGMMQMRRLDEVVIPAGDTVRFEPGGRHLMLFGVSSLGELTEITLRRRDGGPIVARFKTVAVGDG